MSGMLDVADPFEVMRKVNALLGAKEAQRTRRKGCRDREAGLKISPLRQQLLARAPKGSQFLASLPRPSPAGLRP